MDGREHDKENDISLEPWVDCLLKDITKKGEDEIEQQIGEHQHRLFNATVTTIILCLRNVLLNYLTIVWNM